MKKHNFVCLMLWTVSGVMSALGLCMVLLPKHRALTSGSIVGILGIILGIITFFLWRNAEVRNHVKTKTRYILMLLFAILGTLLFSLGIVLCLFAKSLIAGSLTGIFGITLLLCLIPLIKGAK